MRGTHWGDWGVGTGWLGSGGSGVTAGGCKSGDANASGCVSRASGAAWCSRCRRVFARSITCAARMRAIAAAGFNVRGDSGAVTVA